MRIPVALTLIVLLAAGCQKYVPANLPLQLGDSSDQSAYQDDLGRTIGAADADGPEYRLTLQDGTQFFMKSGRIRGDSVIGYYRPTKESATGWRRSAWRPSRSRSPSFSLWTEGRDAPQTGSAQSVHR